MIDAGRRPSCPGEGEGPPDALPGPGLSAADLPRAGPRCAGALPAADYPADRAGQRGGPRISRPDDFALRRGLVYATVLIDAETGRRVDVVPGRTADVAEEWLRGHPGVEVVCRDGSGAYGEAVRRALPGAVRVSDRWHLWHGLGEAVRKEVAAHCGCWAGTAPLQAGKRAETTLERWQQVHDLLGKGAGLLECARRLDLAVNTVKRYARAERPERLQRTPQYRPALVDPYLVAACLAGAAR